jgi:hypothetical protein
MNSKMNREAAGFDVEESDEETDVPTEEVDTKEEEAILDLPDDPVKKAEKISEMLSKFSSTAPSASKLLEWKSVCGGEIFILYLFDKAYIYRAMRRQEYNMMMESEQFANLKPLDREAYVVERCLLWPNFSIQEKAGAPAGLYSTLFNEIQSNSLFLSPQTCSELTIKL